jgi:hypothetical protein
LRAVGPRTAARRSLDGFAADGTSAAGRRRDFNKATRGAAHDAREEHAAMLVEIVGNANE